MEQFHRLEMPYFPYYKYRPEIVLLNDDRLYWDRTPLTDKAVHFNWPDIILVDKVHKEAAFTDIAFPLAHIL
jgi:hypothetical protein